MGLKQVIILRGDLAMSTGKQVAQGCHASLQSFVAADTETRETWMQQGARKVVLETNTVENLRERERNAENRGLPVALIQDAGETELEPETVTALGVGPAPEEEIDPVTGDLPLLR